jgi:hypothetical protein
MEPRQLVKPLVPQNICESFRCEPRILFDILAFDGVTQVVTGNPDIFRNTERYPLRLTHILAGMLFNSGVQSQSPIGGDERMIQRYGLRVRGHDTYYINPEYPLFPLWHNVINASAAITAQGLSTWKLPKYVILGRRDTIEVEVNLIATPASAERVSVQFHCVGVISREPKILTGFIDLTTTVSATIPTDFYRNDGLEPLEIHKVVFNDAAPINTANPTGNIRNVRARIRVAGNGTNSWWTRGPVNTPPINERAPAPLWGATVGRCVTHKIPGDGWLWGSGEGVSIDVQSYVPTRTESVIVSMVGYIEIT